MVNAIFLDRDGTINYDSGYVYKLSDLIVLDNTKEWLQKLKELWYLLILVTNQSWIGRWYYTESDFHAFNSELENQIQICFDAILFCWHLDNENCNCRKPNPGMLHTAINKFWINIKNSYIIGDKDSDIEAGRRIGCKTVRICNQQYPDLSNPDYRVQSINDFVFNFL